MILTLLSILGLAACGKGGSGDPINPVVIPTYTAPAQPPVGSIASVVAAAVAEPYLTDSTVMHYCDCQIGKSVAPASGCTVGDDVTGDGSEALPFQNVAYPGYMSEARFCGRAS
jgi:hypothetical protein